MKSLCVVVGAGISGCVVAERIASVLGLRVLVLEKRKVVGGNSFADIDPETGIECHRYGSHIFHTLDRRVWDYANRFTQFSPYRHKVLLRSGGRVYSMPINLKTINDHYGRQFSPGEARTFLEGEIRKEAISRPRNLEEKAISLVGRRLYECTIRGYTAKQWGRDPRDLPETIINRLPVRYTYDDEYFATPWQGIPSNGFAAWFDAMLASPLVEVRTGVDWFKVRDRIPADAIVVYTGMIDELFSFRHGHLDWRSLRFEWETRPERDFQGTSVMNYGDPDVPFTRIHEFKHYHPEWKDSFDTPTTVVCREYPQVWKPGLDAFYPVNDEANERKLALYREEVARFPNLFVGGRLGAYRYWDMDGAIANALDLFETIKARLGR